METPWHTYPDIRAGSIGWRMGRGEDFLTAFRQWFGQLSPADRAAFEQAHPAPAGWEGFYERLT